MMKTCHLLMVAQPRSLAIRGSARRGTRDRRRPDMVKSGVLKTVGEATETAVDIAVDEINAKGGIGGKTLKLIKFDTGSDPKQAATAPRNSPRTTRCWPSSARFRRRGGSRVPGRRTSRHHRAAERRRRRPA